MLGHYFFLFCALIVLMILVPLSSEWQIRGPVINLVFSGILFSGVYAASTRRWQVIVSLILGLPWILSSWTHSPSGGFQMHVMDLIMGTLFYAFTAFIILARIVGSKRVTKDVLFGAASIYLLIGITGALVYVVVDILAPGSVILAAGEDPREVLDFSKYLYFSFTTLTTLGYGDISPARPLARSITSLQAVAGVLYTTVVVAWLVSLYQAHKNDPPADGSA